MQYILWIREIFIRILFVWLVLCTYIGWIYSAGCIVGFLRCTSHTNSMLSPIFSAQRNLLKIANKSWVGTRNHIESLDHYCLEYRWEWVRVVNLSMKNTRANRREINRRSLFYMRKCQCFSITNPCWHINA